MVEFKFEIIELEDGTKRKKLQVDNISVLSDFVHAFLKPGDVYAILGLYKEPNIWTITKYVTSDGVELIQYIHNNGNIQEAKVIMSHSKDILTSEYPNSILYMTQYTVAYFPLFSHKHVKPALRE